METREQAGPTGDIKKEGDVNDAEDAENLESNPDMEDPRLYSPLLAHDKPCLQRRVAESAAAGRSVIPCADEEDTGAESTGDDAPNDQP